MRIRFLKAIGFAAFVLASCAPGRAAEQTAVFAGGCFWGVEAVFEHVKGVIDVRSGYAGGTKGSANYDTVSSGETDHAESVEIRFDPAKVTYEQLLYVFFAVAHDPTEIDRQGPDTGRQYRSVVFYQNDAQKRSAEAFVAAINASKALPRSVATKVQPLTAFYTAEKHHQDYLKNNLKDPYIVANDLPKLTALKEKFPDLYRDE